jgi:predicted acyltransferase
VRTAAVIAGPSPNLSPSPDGESPRMLSLDVLRGVTIAGMILVNNPGNYQAAYAPLIHAEWNGWQLADLIFPLFLFIMGVAIPPSLTPRRELAGGRWPTLARIARRAALLFVIGICLNAFPTFHLSELRVPGVLQRIAICYAAASLAFLETRVATQAKLAGVLLVAYWLLLRFVPVPGFGAGILEPDANLSAYIDRQVFGAHHLYHSTWAPEGLLSTMPAIVTTLLGVLAGVWLGSTRSEKAKTVGLLVAGAVGVAAGECLGFLLPINKSLWTSSFVVLTGGIAALLLGACYWVVDVLEVRRPWLPFVVFGRNPIAVYVASSALASVFDVVTVHHGQLVLREWIYRHLFGHLVTPELGSLLFAVGYVALWLVPMGILYRRRIHIRV